LLTEIEQERDAALREVEQVYGPFLSAAQALGAELAELEAFARQPGPTDKAQRKQFREKKKVNAKRLKDIKLELKALEKLAAEAEAKRTAAWQHAERETLVVREAAADLHRICSNPVEAGRYFVVADRPEIEQNEFNLNLPRYVDTFGPEEKIDIDSAL